jgi:hypothetical protein
MELIGGLSDHPAATPADQLLDDIQQAPIRPEERTQAFAASFTGSCGWSTTPTSTGSWAR